VQSGALAVIGALVKDSRTPKARFFALLSVGCFVISICAAANLIGSLPYLAQDAGRIKDINSEEGNLNIPISYSASAQVVFFICGLIAFVLFAWARTDSKETP
jgi:TRAP-type C4-dicarboxylate transport system permease small subunit